VFVLLVAVVSGMAFAQVGRNIPFTQMSFSDKVKVSKVEETANGIKVTYAPQENNCSTAACHYRRLSKLLKPL
jgi:muramidase (phage lysozyme)